jgi:hypothetical protein
VITLNYFPPLKIQSMKSTKKLFFGLSILAVSLSLIISSCQKQATGVNNPANAKQLSLYLTDAPCQYDSVFIDIRYVEVKIDTSAGHMNDDHFGDDDNDMDDDHQHHDQYGKWDTLAISPGIYNILKLRNGVDTLLGTANLPAGKIRKIRLTLGTSNTLVKAGVTYPLNLLAGINNYVYVKIHKEDEDEITPVQSSIWIDFNVCESIKLIGGEYFLKPVLKPFGMKNFGKIEGIVLPNEAQAFVSASNGTDSASAMPENNGEYKIRGLKEGTYNLTFKGSAGYSDTTILNIQVQNGKETHIPTVTLHL